MTAETEASANSKTLKESQPSRPDWDPASRKHERERVAADERARSLAFHWDEIKDPVRLLEKWCAARDPVSLYIRSQLAAPLLKLMDDASSGAIALTKDVRPMLQQELNRLLEGPCLYEPERFASVALSEQVRALIAQVVDMASQRDADRKLVLLNRLLLEQAYPDELAFQPHVGPRPFTRNDGDLFFGRDREVNDLVCLVVAHSAVLLYAQSGAGKTSLINAGLIPQLEAEGFQVLPPARVRGIIPDGIEPANPYVFNSLMFLAGEKAEPARLAQMSLLGFLARLPACDLLDAHALVAKLRDSEDRLSSRLRERAGPDLAQLLRAPWDSDVSGASAHEVLATELNRLLQDPTLLDSELLASLSLTDSTRKLLANRAVSDPVWLNRLVLEEAYPEAIAGRFHDASRQHRASDATLTPRVIIFDQLEELFGAYPDRWTDREDFFVQIADAAKADRTLRVLFVMREDYIANLDPYVRLLPERLRTRYRLLRMSGEAALHAITGPLRGTGRSFEPGAAESLVQELLEIRVQTATGDMVEVPGEFIEPVQLQVVCQTLWKELPQLTAVVTAEQVKRFGDVNQALRRFYERALDVTSARTGITEADLRGWFDQHLITAAGTRGLVFRDRDTTGGIPNVAVDELEDQHLIRAEIRAGARWYELTHDRLIEPIQRSNRASAQQTHTDRLTKQLKQEAQQALKHVRNSLLAYGFVAALVLLAIAGWGWYRAARARDDEQQAREYAVQARDAAREARDDAVRARDNERDLAELADYQRELAVIEAARASAAEKTAGKELRLRTSKDGLRLLEQQDIAGSLLWFARVLQMDRGNASLESIHRARLGAAPRQMARLAQMWYHKELLYVEFSQDGRYVLTAGADKTAAVWDAVQGRPLAILTHDKPVNHASFSRNGRYVVTASGTRGAGPGSAHVWDLSGATPDGKTSPHRSLDFPGAVIFAQFQPTDDAPLVATASETQPGSGGQARVWDWQANAHDTLLEHDKGRVNHVTFSRDGTRLIGSGRDPAGAGESRVWLLDDGRWRERIVLRHRSEVNWAAFSPTSVWIVTASGVQGADTGEARVWDAQTGAPKTPPLRHEDGVIHACFSDDGRHVVTSSHDTTARLWDVTQRDPLVTILRHGGSVNRAAFSPDGRFVATASRDQTVYVWEVPSGNLALPALDHRGTVGHVAFSADGTGLLTASLHIARVWHVATGNPAPTVLASSGWVNHVALSSDGRQAVTASGHGAGAAGEAQVWNLDGGEPLTLRHAGPVHYCTLDPGEGHRVISVARVQRGMPNDVRVWDASDGAAVSRLNIAAIGPNLAVGYAALSSDGSLAVTVSTTAEHHQPLVHTWDTATGDQVAALNFLAAGVAGPVNHAAFSPDGRYLVTASGDVKSKLGAALVWNARTGQPVASPLQHRGGVLHASFSPDGTRVITAGADDTARIWNTLSGALVWQSPPGEAARDAGHTADVTHASFSRDGTLLLTVSLDNTAKVWDARTGQRRASLTPCHFAALSDDGRRAVTAGRDGSLRVWDVATGELITILMHRGDLKHVAFSGPKGSRVVVVSYSWLAAGDGQPPAVQAGLHEEEEPLDPGDPENSGLREDGPNRRVHAQVWDISEVPQSVNAEFLRKLAELASARTIDREHADLVPLEPDTLYHLWSELHEQDAFDLLTQGVASSHEQTARECEANEQWFAAAWHLGRIIARAEGPRKGALLERRALALTRLGLPDHAIRDYSEAIEHDPGNWRVRDGLAQAYANRGQWQAAIERYTQAIELAPERDHARLRDARGSAYAGLQQWQPALADYSEAARLEPRQATYLAHRAGAHSELDAWQPAAADAAAAVELDPFNRDAWELLAIAQLVLNDRQGYQRTCDGMLRRFRRTLDAETANNVAWIAVLTPDAVSDFARAVELAGFAVTSDAKNYYYLNTHGAALYRAGRFVEAAGRLREAMQAHTGQFGEPAEQAVVQQSRGPLIEESGTAWDWLFLAMTQHRLGDAAEAQRWLDRATHWINQRTQPSATPLAARYRQELRLLRQEAESLIKGPKN